MLPQCLMQIIDPYDPKAVKDFDQLMQVNHGLRHVYHHVLDLLLQIMLVQYLSQLVT